MSSKKSFLTDNKSEMLQQSEADFSALEAALDDGPKKRGNPVIEGLKSCF